MARALVNGFRTPQARKIYLDRYALKTLEPSVLGPGSTVVMNPPDATEKRGRREVAVVLEYNGNGTVRVKSEETDREWDLPLTHVDIPLELTYEDTAKRVGEAIGEGEHADTIEAMVKMLANREFVPSGRILTAAGSGMDLTCYNCYVLPSPKDSREGILETTGKQFEIMSRGGGVGINVSSLRPKRDIVKGVNGRSSGAVEWADLFSFMTFKVEQAGSRRGALMIILDVWHPDIVEFIKSKKELGFLDYANISVGLTQEFMRAVENDDDWELVFPDREDPDYDNIWDGDLEAWCKLGKKVKVYKTVKARDIWTDICENAWGQAEPGLFFVDQANRMSNSWYYPQGRLRCTNPCGEQPLPGNAVCNLGAINLGLFVKRHPDGHFFWSTLHEGDLTEDIEAMIKDRLDLDRLRQVAIHATRFLDNVIDKTYYFLPENEEQQKSERRIGLGIMGLAEMFVRMGVKYGDKVSEVVTDIVFKTIRDAAYESSIQIAKEKGAFPWFNAQRFLESGYANTLPENIRTQIREHGIRNVTLLTVAPTGTTGSMMATSTGIEPYFLFAYDQIGNLGRNRIEEPIVREFRTAMKCDEDHELMLPPHFVTTADLEPRDHVGIQAIGQRYVDSAISKTSNLPREFTVEQVKEFYEKLYKLGCKGGTVYRDGSREEQCLEAPSEESAEHPQLSGPEVAPLPSEPRAGFTHSGPTPLGAAHVTVTTDESGQPFDAFINLSKAGSESAAHIAAIGRLISYNLRLRSDVPRATRLKGMIEQLEGIASMQMQGFGESRVLSVPDGIAKVLRKLATTIDASNVIEHKRDVSEAKDLTASTGSRYTLTCPSCGNNTAVMADGCFKCTVCGYSQC